MAEEFAGFRVGEYGIRTIPGNIVLGKYGLVSTGPKKGEEIVIPKSQVYYSNWSRALKGLYEQLLDDCVSKNNTRIVRGMMESQEEAYNMIDEHLKHIKSLPDKPTL